jgi:hypothetical protein
MMPVRVCMTVLFLLAASVVTLCLLTDSLYPGMSSTDFNTVIGMSGCITLYCIYLFYPILFLINICEREQYSIRQRRLVPRNGLLRFLYFLHATGVANAILWYLLFLIAGVFLFFVWYFLVSGDGYHEFGFFVKDILWRFPAFAIMVYCWAVTMFGVWKLFLHRILPREWLSFPLFCFGIICFIFYCVAMMAFPYSSRETISILFAIFPIVIFEDKGVMAQYFFGITGAAIITVVSAPMIFNAYHALSPCDAPKILSETELQEMIAGKSESRIIKGRCYKSNICFLHHAQRQSTRS